MSRYDFDQEPEDVRNEALRSSQDPSRSNESLNLRGQGSGTGEGKANQEHERGLDIRSNELRDEEIRLDPIERSEERRNREHEPKHKLRDSEVETLVDLGTFRILNRDDLVTYRYGGDQQNADRDLNHLAEHGLIQQRVNYPEREIHLTLSREGLRYLEHNRPSSVSEDQAFHRGFLKRPESSHDATLYRAYQCEAERIRRAGGEVRRVALDFELKKSINQRLAKIHSLPAEEQSREKQQIAQDHGLTVVSGKIPLPDLRLEYETANREQAKVDIELLSSDYRPSQIAAKARAGFTMYALSQDAARLRPALADPELMQEIFSL